MLVFALVVSSMLTATATCTATEAKAAKLPSWQHGSETGPPRWLWKKKDLSYCLQENGEWDQIVILRRGKWKLTWKGPFDKEFGKEKISIRCPGKVRVFIFASDEYIQNENKPKNRYLGQFKVFQEDWTEKTKFTNFRRVYNDDRIIKITEPETYHSCCEIDMPADLLKFKLSLATCTSRGSYQHRREEWGTHRIGAWPVFIPQTMDLTYVKELSKAEARKSPEPQEKSRVDESSDNSEDDSEGGGESSRLTWTVTVVSFLLFAGVLCWAWRNLSILPWLDSLTGLTRDIENY